MRRCVITIGGQPAAAGFSIDANRIDEFRDCLTAYCKAHVTAEEYIPLLLWMRNYLLMISDVDIIDRVSALEPYGMANSTPVFAVMEATVQDIMLMGPIENHCKVI